VFLKYLATKTIESKKLPLGERPFINIRIVQIRLILNFENHTEFFSSENIDSNYTKWRNMGVHPTENLEYMCHKFELIVT
jgi:hypothetical protein